jgi:hypothetical protein
LLLSHIDVKIDFCLDQEVGVKGNFDYIGFSPDHVVEVVESFFDVMLVLVDVY